MREMIKEIYTIGHSNHNFDDFIAIVHQHGIDTICDVRSQPYSKFNPQFSYENLSKSIPSNHIEYVFMGNELGARAREDHIYKNGKVQYELLARTDEFQRGIRLVLNMSDQKIITLMCSEKDPISCHRSILVCRELKTFDLHIQHLLFDGSLEGHDALERRLMKQFDLEPNLILTEEDCLKEAYRMQGERIAFVSKDRTTESAE